MSDLKFILGTEGQPDYLVVAQVPGSKVVLGVKPMLSIGMTQALCGIRVRSTVNQKVGESTVQVSQKDLLWDGFTFNKVSDVRASMQMGVQVEGFLKEPEALKSTKAAEYLTQWLVDRIPHDCLVVNGVQIRDFLLNKWTRTIKKSFPDTVPEAKQVVTEKGTEALPELADALSAVPSDLVDSPEEEAPKVTDNSSVIHFPKGK